MARSRSAAAGLDRGAVAEHRICGRRDRALRQGPTLRADSRARHAGNAARPPALLADLRGSRTPGLAAWNSGGLDLPPFHHLAGMAELLHRGLRQPYPSLSVAGGEPGLRRCVRQISRPQSGAARIRGDMASRILVAVLEI